eukprot:1397288-Amphidinium_carterae.1
MAALLSALLVRGCKEKTDAKARRAHARNGLATRTLGPKCEAKARISPSITKGLVKSKWKEKGGNFSFNPETPDVILHQGRCLASLHSQTSPDNSFCAECVEPDCANQNYHGLLQITTHKR